MSKVTAYKAFDKDFKCRDHQFKVGESYEHKGEISICNSGYHSCSYPMDIANYYDILESRFGIVEVSGKMQDHKDDSKICSSRLHVKAEISLAEIIKASVDWHFNGWFKKAKKDGKTAASKPLSNLASSGGGSKLASSGNDSKLASSGNDSKLASSGDYSNLASSGYGSNLASSGNDSKLASSGYGSKLASSGNDSKLASSGDYSNLASSGNDSKLASSGYGSKLASSGGGSNVIVSAEKNVMVKGSPNTLICLTHYINDKPTKFVTGQIGKDGLKPDTWYGLNAKGEFEENK